MRKASKDIKKGFLEEVITARSLHRRVEFGYLTREGVKVEEKAFEESETMSKSVAS